MKIKVKRKAKSSWHKNWVQDVSDAVQFAADEYNLAKKNIKVDVVLKNDPSVDYAGVCLTMEAMKRFVLVLNAAYVTDEEHVFRLAFHEMTHVKQEFHNGLVMDDTTEAHYEGMVYSFASDEQYQEAYWDLPWEVEAREMEKELLERWNNRLTS